MMKGQAGKMKADDMMKGYKPKKKKSVNRKPADAVGFAQELATQVMEIGHNIKKGATTGKIDPNAYHEAFEKEVAKAIAKDRNKRFNKGATNKRAGEGAAIVDRL